MSQFSMATGLITVDWAHFKDFVERYSLTPSVKYATDDDTYLIIVPSDGYAYRCIIKIEQPASQEQQEFEQMFGIV